MGTMPIGEKWDYPDAHYKSKKISTWFVELTYGTERGGRILLWKKATPDDIYDAEKLPHVYTVSDDGKWALQDSVQFMDWQNAVWYYDELDSVKDINDLMWENR